MNQKMQTGTTWHPLGIQGETLSESGVVDLGHLRGRWRMARQTAVPFRTFLTIDQTESYGFRRNARVINF